MMKNIRIKSIQQNQKSKTQPAKQKEEPQKSKTKKEKKEEAETFFRKHKNITPKQQIGEERARLGFGKSLLIIIGVILLGGASSVITKDYIFPWLISKPQFAENTFLKKATEGTTIINTTKEVVTEEKENAITTGISTAAASIVGIYHDDEFVQTGVILTNDGLILAPSTIIDPAETYTVKTRKGNAHEAKVLDRNSALGIVVLRIEGENLPVITLADTTNMEPGERVVALHYEANAKQSVAVIPSFISSLKSLTLEEGTATELLSATNEVIVIVDNTKEYEFLITTNGDITGIRTRVTEKGNEKQETQYMNIDDLRDIIAQATKGEKLGYPEMGLKGTIITKELQQSKKLISEKGYLVTEVAEAGPAAEAELEVDDIITEIDNEEILPSTNIANILKKYSAGDVLKLKVLRPLNAESGTVETIAIEIILE